MVPGSNSKFYIIPGAFFKKQLIINTFYIMAKVAKKAAAAAPAKKERKPREKKDSFLKNNYVEINKYDGIITEAMHIRGIGSLVRERNEAGTALSSVFIPGVKIKTKKDWKYLQLDKGPKSKKGAEDSEDQD